MSVQFTFVSVNLTEKRIGSRLRSQGIGAADRSKIRSLTATNPRNRRQQGQVQATSCNRNAKVQSLKQSKRSGEEFEREELDSEPTPVDLNLSSYDTVELHSTYAIDLSSSSLPDGEAIFDATTDYTFYTPEAELQVVENQPTNEAYQSLQNLGPLVHDLALRLPRKIRTDRIDPFWAFAIPYQPFLSAVINHRVTHLSPVITELDIPQGERVSLKFFTSFMDDGAFMFSMMLWSAAHLHVGHMDAVLSRGLSEPIQEEQLLWLKGSAISALNKSLAASMTIGQSDSAIATVLTLAFFEYCFGEPGLAETHIKGCRKLIALRGGLNCINPLQRRVLKWMSAASRTILDSYADSSLLGLPMAMNRYGTQTIPEPSIAGVQIGWNNGKLIPNDILHVGCGRVAALVTNER